METKSRLCSSPPLVPSGTPLFPIARRQVSPRPGSALSHLHNGHFLNGPNGRDESLTAKTGVSLSLTPWAGDIGVD